MDTVLSAANEERHVNTIKVSSAAIRIVRPKSNETPLAQRRLLRRRDNPPNDKQHQAQVIVTQFLDK